MAATTVTLTVQRDDAATLPVVVIRDPHSFDTDEEASAYAEALLTWVDTRPLPDSNVRLFVRKMIDPMVRIERIMRDERWPDLRATSQRT